MKLKRRLLIAVTFIAIIVLVQACRKFDFSSNEPKSPEFTVAEAKEWYYGVFKKTKEFAKLDTSSPFVAQKKISLQKYPDWKKATQYNMGGFKFVEMPYVSTMNVFFPLGELQIKSENEKRSVANSVVNHILFISKNGKTDVRLLTWIPTLEYAKEKEFDFSEINFSKSKTDFCGYLILRNWDEKIISIHKVIQGKIMKKEIGAVKREKSTTVNAQSSNLEGSCVYSVPLFLQSCTHWISFTLDYPSVPGGGSNGDCDAWEISEIGSIEINGDCPFADDWNYDDGIDNAYYDCLENSAENCACLYFGLYCDLDGDGDGDDGGVGDPPPSGGPLTYNGYTFSAQDLYRINFIKNEISLVDQAYNNAGNDYCYGTGKLGNMFFPGTVEHWLIQCDYINRYPGGVREYSIPNASLTNPSNRGYADIANLVTKEIFEIKPFNPAGITSAVFEAGHYVSKANTECNNGIWSLGTNYSGTILPNPKDPLTNISTTLYSNGVILYNLVPKSTNPLPVPLPQTIFDKLKQLAQRLKNNLNNAEYEIQIFLNNNPELVTYIKNAAITTGVGIIIATIVEDILTAGAGIADDWACFLAGYKLIRFAMIMP